VFLTVAIGAPCLLLVMGPHFIPVFQRMARRPQQVQDRFELIDIAIQMFAEHPFAGGGLGSFRLAAGEIAHNTAMWFLADFGVIGLAILVGFLGWFFWKGWLAYHLTPDPQRPLVLALLVAHAAMLGLAMGIEAFYQRHWWLVFALLASSYSLAIRQSCRLRQECGGPQSW
jgi:putative inorganic carbon (hco3(-)) transporter